MCNQEFFNEVLKYYEAIKQYVYDNPVTINNCNIYLKYNDIIDLVSICKVTAEQYINKFVIFVDDILQQVTISYCFNDEDYQNKLEQALKQYDDYYYINSTSLISDYVYDLYKHKLKKESLGSDISDDSNTEKHLKKMYSLGNVYSEDELLQWLSKYSNPEICIQHKVDGLSINILYQYGKLVKATTRGNGIVGENVTENVLTISSIPKSIKDISTIEIRGEIYLPVKEFNRINEEREEQGLKPFSSPRNAASGTLKLKDVEEVKNRNLEAIFYDIGYAEGEELPTTHNEIISFLKYSGFKTVENFTIVSNEKYFNNIKDYIKLVYETRDKISYDIDGLVIKINNIDTCNTIGYSDKVPKWATAYKFKDEEAITTLLDVEYQVGKTGNITPVAIVSPTPLSNCIINRCTLHNKDEIKRLRLSIGDRIVIVRSAEVIPKIIRVEEYKGDTLVEYPSYCPECGAPLHDYKNSITKCLNENCKGILKQKLYYFVSKQALDIDCLGPSLIDKLVENNYVKTFTDIYNITREELLSLDRIGESIADSVLTNISKSKSVVAYVLLQSLSIQCIGEKTAKALLYYFTSIENMIDYFNNNDEEFNLKGVNKDAIVNIREWCRRESSKTLIKTFKSLGFNMEIQRVNSNNKTVLITGTLQDFKRNDLQKILEQKGYKIASSVSKNLDYLIVGENPGSKLEKAKLLNINIITEDKLKEFLGE